MTNIKLIAFALIISMLFNAIGKAQRHLAYQCYNNGYSDAAMAYREIEDNPCVRSRTV